MRRKILFVYTVFFCIALCAQTDEYTLVFSEDFNGSSLDLTKWNIEEGRAANQEKQYYTNGNNLRLENGQLIISGRKEQAVSDRDYTSARINTKGKGYIKYGKVEARISVPAGAGTWPAFWMMPEANVYGGWPYSGEIDIMEHIGSDPRMVSHAVHTANKNGSRGNNWNNVQYRDNVENNFRVYALEWGPDEMSFYIDGVKSVTLYRNFTEDYKGWPFDQNFYVILNLALGGTMGGTIDDAIFDNPVEMKVDYVRMYQNTNTSVPEIKDNNIQVFPTQFSNEITIKTTIPTEIKLYNSLGKLMLQQQVNGSGILETNSFPNGMYLLKTNQKTIKLIK